MATKKKIDTPAVETTEGDVSLPIYRNFYGTETASVPDMPFVASTAWIHVEDATGLTTLAMNLPVGVMVMTIIDNKTTSMQYIGGIHYDKERKCFTL